MDETGVTVVHKPGKVVTEVGRRNVWAVTSGEKGKTHTILSCVSADEQERIRDEEKRTRDEEERTSMR